MVEFDHSSRLTKADELMMARAPTNLSCETRKHTVEADAVVSRELVCRWIFLSWNFIHGQQRHWIFLWLFDRQRASSSENDIVKLRFHALRRHGEIRKYFLTNLVLFFRSVLCSTRQPCIHLHLRSTSLCIKKNWRKWKCQKSLSFNNGRRGGRSFPAIFEVPDSFFFPVRNMLNVNDVDDLTLQM